MIKMVIAALAALSVAGCASAPAYNGNARGLAPQSNQYVCQNPQRAQNQDLCDRQRYNGRGGA